MSFDFISLEAIQEIAHQYGYLAVFLGILLENLGVPLPGETVTLAGGFLAGSGELNYWLVLISAASGALLGGTCGYWLGRWGGWALLLGIGKFFRIQEGQLVNLRQQFSDNAAKTVFLGRFIALLRIFASPLAGIVEMPFLKFMVYNLAGALAWASVMVSLSFFAGRLVSLEQLITWVGQFTLLALVLLVAAVALPLWLETRKAKEEAE